MGAEMGEEKEGDNGQEASHPDKGRADHLLGLALAGGEELFRRQPCACRHHRNRNNGQPLAEIKRPDSNELGQNIPDQSENEETDPPYQKTVHQF